MPGLTILVLTKDEEIHIERCLTSAFRAADRVVIVDSFSTDRTVEIAKTMGAEVYQNPFVSQANQINWAIDRGLLSTGWIFRLDADEWLDNQAVKYLRDELPRVPEDVHGIWFSLGRVFLNRRLRWGGVGHRWMLRCWRAGHARSDAALLDEKMVLDGGLTCQAEGTFVDDNLNSLTWWITKHNRYASREAAAFLLDVKDRSASDQQSGQAARIRWFKRNVYERMPPFVRPVMHFSFRYGVRMGFMDGWQGLAFHVLQAFWFRFLVDAKVREVQEYSATHGVPLEQAVRERLDLSP